MKKKERIARIEEILDRFFPDPQIPLHHQDPYTLLVAVVLSAHTTDKSVNNVTKTLFPKADTPQKMVLLSYEEILDIIRPCGLGPSKAKALLELSQILIRENDGEVPRTFEELEKLPGVGHKTAAVVLSQAFGMEAFAVDTHVHRLAKRWKLSSGKSVLQTEKDLKKAFAPNLWAKRHLQMILFGREYCKAVSHKIEKCPICKELFPATGP